MIRQSPDVRSSLATLSAAIRRRTVCGQWGPAFRSGNQGHRFQSPFASPPGKGLSSSTVNVLWGAFNLAVAYVLVVRVGRFDLRRTRHVAVLGLGALLIALRLAQHFGELHGGLL